MTNICKYLLMPTAAIAMPALAGDRMVFSAAGAGSAAQQGAVANAPAMAAPKATKDRLICKRGSSFDTGSHIRAAKTCLKESEWKEREDSAERFFRSVDDRMGGRDLDPAGMQPN